MYTQFSLRWYSACKNGSKKHRNTRRNAALFLFESQEYYCITAIKSSKFQSIFGIFGRHFVGFLVIVAVRAPLWIPRGPKRALKAAQRRFGDIFLGNVVSFWGPGGVTFKLPAWRHHILTDQCPVNAAQPPKRRTRGGPRN